MRTDENHTPGEKNPKRRRFNWEIYYVEKVGSRYVLRFGHMFWVLIALALVGFLIVLIFDSRRH